MHNLDDRLTDQCQNLPCNPDLFVFLIVTVTVFLVWVRT